MTPLSREPLQNDLDPLLRDSGLSEAEVEVLFNLALGPASDADLRWNAKLKNDEDVESTVASLSRRRLVHPGGAADPRHHLADPGAIRDALPGLAGRRLALLARATRPAFFPAVVLNPALPPGGGSLGARYEELREAFDSRLPQVEIRTQTVCNLGCIYCYIRKDPRDSLTSRQLLNMFRRASASGVNRLILTGGESTMRKDLPVLIRGARQAGFVDVQLFTNGLMFSYPDQLAAVMEAGLTSICLHASSTDARLYERLASRDRYGALEAAVRNLSRYPELEVTLLSVVNRLNLHQLPETVSFFREWQRRTGFKRFVNHLIHCCVYSSSWDHRDSVLCSLTEAVPVVRALVETYRSEPDPVMYQNIPICLMPDLEAHSYDLYLTFARLLRATGRFDFTPLDTMFVKPPTCRSCVHWAYCIGLPRGYVRLFGSDEIHPVTASGT
ncbi:MAG: radical SAM protein [Polyangia bacterium]|jgi:hypothetical protein|nr:radical SAM protein [Polyangia bacterium]